jgi:segregation and condensation protein B
MPEDPAQDGAPSRGDESVALPLSIEDVEEFIVPASPRDTASAPPSPALAPVVPAAEDAFSEGDELDLEEASLPRPDDEILLEAALFASTELLTLRHLKELVDPTLTAPKVQKLVTSINQRLLDGGHPFEIVSAAGGWRLRTRPELYPWLRGLFKEVQNRRLSQAVLETLAVVAYKQPITKAEIEAVRGVSADGALKKLLEKKLVTVSGRTDTPGRPLTYGTTREFLEYFGISKLPDDLPRLAEFEELVQSRSLLPQVAPGGVLLQAEQQEE